MRNLKQRLERLKELTRPVALFTEVMKNDMLKELIINLNTQDQLFKEGINSKGRKLEDIGGPYAESTIEGIPGVFKGKKELGLPFDRVTLFQDGTFYGSFKVTTDSQGDILINADPNKDGTNLFNEWGEAVLGLTPENVDVFRRELKFWIHKYIRDAYNRT